MQAAKAAAIRVAQEWIAQAAPVLSAPQRRVISSALGAGAARERVRVLSTVGRGETKENTEVLSSSGGDNLLRGLSPEQVRVVLSWFIVVMPSYRYKKASVCHPPYALLSCPVLLCCLCTVRAQMTACLHRREAHIVCVLGGDE